MYSSFNWVVLAFIIILYVCADRCMWRAWAARCWICSKVTIHNWPNRIASWSARMISSLWRKPPSSHSSHKRYVLSWVFVLSACNLQVIFTYGTCRWTRRRETIHLHSATVTRSWNRYACASLFVLWFLFFLPLRALRNNKDRCDHWLTLTLTFSPIFATS